MVKEVLESSSSSINHEIGCLKSTTSIDNGVVDETDHEVREIFEGKMKPEKPLRRTTESSDDGAGKSDSKVARTSLIPVLSSASDESTRKNTNESELSCNKNTDKQNNNTKVKEIVERMKSISTVKNYVPDLNDLSSFFPTNCATDNEKKSEISSETCCRSKKSDYDRTENIPAEQVMAHDTSIPVSYAEVLSDSEKDKRKSLRKVKEFASTLQDHLEQLNSENVPANTEANSIKFDGAGTNETKLQVQEETNAGIQSVECNKDEKSTGQQIIATKRYSDQDCTKDKTSDKNWSGELTAQKLVKGEINLRKSYQNLRRSAGYSQILNDDVKPQKTNLYVAENTEEKPRSQSLEAKSSSVPVEQIADNEERNEAPKEKKKTMKSRLLSSFRRSKRKSAIEVSHSESNVKDGPKSSKDENQSAKQNSALWKSSKKTEMTPQTKEKPTVENIEGDQKLNFEYAGSNTDLVKSPAFNVGNAELSKKDKEPHQSHLIDNDHRKKHCIIS